MDTLGAILLHEYTHFRKLFNPPLSRDILDVDGGYGAGGTRNLDKSQATGNADSFVWFANEVFWRAVCKKEYDDPTDPDSNDPSCDNSPCEDDTEP